jgi:DNA-binding Lrp family transcriptional regulator
MYKSSFYICYSFYIHMPEAFVLMNAELGSEESIINELKKIDLIKHVYQVYGVYDIVALVEGETMDKVKETITWNLRKLNGVKSTLTMIVME